MTTLVPSFLNESSSFLQVTRTTMHALMSLNFCQIQQLTTELATLESLRNQCIYLFSVAIDIVLFNLQIRRKRTISWMNYNFGQIEQQTT